MRSLHRGVMTVVALLLLYWVASGLVMAIYDVQDGAQSWAREGGGAGARPVPSLPVSEIDSMLDVTTRAAAAAAPGAPLEALALRVVNGVPLGLVGTGGSTPRQFVFNARTGAVLNEQAAEPPDAPGGTGSLFMATYLPSLHNRIKDWHRGNAFGDTGIWLALAAGCGLLILTVSGLWTYFQMLVRRRQSGHRSLFWR